MFENITEAEVMQRMLARVPDKMDKREGSIIYDALAPAAQELMILYSNFDLIVNSVFADTAPREYLIRRAEEKGLSPFPATKAIWRGEFNIDIDLGSRFYISALVYIAISKIDTGVYRMECETPGAIGNTKSGALIPTEPNPYIEGLTSAQLVSVIVPGEDEESTEDFRKRYFDIAKTSAFAGNGADYKTKTKAVPGVGGVKVYRVWNGGGTVKLVITDALNHAPTPELVSIVQEAIDPTQDAGGYGIAPIGHIVTVTGAESAAINITTTLTYEDGYEWATVGQAVLVAIDTYLNELSAYWENTENIIVRISRVETRILGVTGIADIANTAINSTAANLTLDEDYVPVRGTFNGT